MNEALVLARRLAGQAGLAEPVSVERLAGGKNNRVFAVSHADGLSRILKSYNRSTDDPRDRLGTEWRFLAYARARGIEAVPAPLAIDPEAGAALYSRLPGTKLAPGAVEGRHLAAALDFIVALNEAPRELSGLAPGSEACFSLADHILTVERRVARLAMLDPEAPHRDAAARFVAERLAPAWEAAKARIGASNLPLAEALPLAARVVSPSDFGFHNALVAGERVGFLDFEYAGLDDPAKLVGDFFSVPEIPTPLAGLADFIEGLAARLDLGADFPARARLLLDAYRVKWACIILNDFLPLGAARRDFALGEDRAARCRAQLAKAEARIEDVFLG